MKKISEQYTSNDNSKEIIDINSVLQNSILKENGLRRCNDLF